MSKNYIYHKFNEVNTRKQNDHLREEFKKFLKEEAASNNSRNNPTIPSNTPYYYPFPFPGFHQQPNTMMPPPGFHQQPNHMMPPPGFHQHPNHMVPPPPPPPSLPLPPPPPSSPLPPTVPLPTPPPAPLQEHVLSEASVEPQDLTITHSNPSPENDMTGKTVTETVAETKATHPSKRKRKQASVNIPRDITETNLLDSMGKFLNTENHRQKLLYLNFVHFVTRLMERNPKETWDVKRNFTIGELLLMGIILPKSLPENMASFAIKTVNEILYRNANTYSGLLAFINTYLEDDNFKLSKFGHSGPKYYHLFVKTVPKKNPYFSFNNTIGSMKAKTVDPIELSQETELFKKQFARALSLLERSMEKIGFELALQALLESTGAVYRLDLHILKNAQFKQYADFLVKYHSLARDTSQTLEKNEKQQNSPMPEKVNVSGNSTEVILPQEEVETTKTIEAENQKDLTDPEKLRENPPHEKS